ncbi:sulfotransferase [Micromonospora sp. Llam7]|uniref:sulfotransferase family protein n=1 Tax=Micromonospora tarapacensis TaxID=2835305 RepID=UPI001C828F16|nr:sulfotransferase [Micromonospora tarapacensis]MBX7266821.1 sulfotransferase [Micromonospora tarapacensis]
MTGTVLDADELTRAALADGAGHPGDLRFQPALRRLVQAINDEARLTPDGARVARASLVGSLRTQLRLAARPVPPAPRPVAVTVVTGLHRTGTTLFQTLLAAHPGVRAPQLWELLAPAATQPAAELVAAATRYVDEYHRAAPAFAAIHPLHARKPEECHRLIANSFHSEIYGLRYHVPGYLGWLARQDHTAAYALHREQLDAIVARDSGGGHLVLKCPFHLWHAADLAATYPQARVVRLHRDPVAAVASVCSLTRTVRAARSAHVDPHEIGAFWLDRTAAAVPGLHDPDAFAGLAVFDLRYRELIADPVAAVARVCAFAGLPFDAPARQAVRTAAQTAARGAPGRHHYRLTDYGLDEERVRRRFADYRAAYRL